MKPELRRIEATLGQLDGKQAEPQIDPRRSVRQVETAPLPDAVHPPKLATPSGQTPSLPRIRPGHCADRVQPFPVQENCPRTPSLPRAKPASISHHRHAANPSLAVSLLKEIEAKVGVWQQELEQVIQQIRSLYEEGPIVDGWLESQLAGGAAQVMQPIKLATLRHAEVEHLMEYVEEICSTKPTLVGQEEPSGTTYRLCGLDADGQLWSRPCPAQQVPYVSLAIARYQKLRILLGKKQTLENRLQQLVQTLTLLHGQLEEPTV